MSKFQCSICSAVFNEDDGIPENCIAPGTKWQDISDDFACPLCGVPKSAFYEIIETVKKESAVPIEEQNFDGFNTGLLRMI